MMRFRSGFQVFSERFSSILLLIVVVSTIGINLYLHISTKVNNFVPQLPPQLPPSSNIDSWWDLAWPIGLVGGIILLSFIVWLGSYSVFGQKVADELESLFQPVARIAESFANLFESLIGQLTTFDQANADQSERSNVVAQNYLHRLQGGSTKAVCALLALGLLMWINESYLGASVLALLAFAIVFHVTLTRFRVKHGLFGSNAHEALELIGYITEHAHTSGTPPGTRVSHPYNESTAVKKGSLIETAGVSHEW